MSLDNFLVDKSEMRLTLAPLSPDPCRGTLDNFAHKYLAKEPSMTKKLFEVKFGVSPSIFSRFLPVIGNYFHL